MGKTAEEIYAPYSERATLKQTIAWAHVQALRMGVAQEVVIQGMRDVFKEMADGKEFDKNGTEELPYPHTKMNHYLLKYILLLHHEKLEVYVRFINKKTNPPWLLDKERNWIARAFRWIFGRS